MDVSLSIWGKNECPHLSEEYQETIPAERQGIMWRVGLDPEFSQICVVYS